MPLVYKVFTSWLWTNEIITQYSLNFEPLWTHFWSAFCIIHHNRLAASWHQLVVRDMWTTGYFSKPAFLAFLEKFLLAPLVITKVVKWKCVPSSFLLEEVLGAGCSVFVCGRLISGWTDFGQFVQTKPSNIFLESSLSCMSMLHPQ